MSTLLSAATATTAKEQRQIAVHVRTTIVWWWRTRSAGATMIQRSKTGRWRSRSRRFHGRRWSSPVERRHQSGGDDDTSEQQRRTRGRPITGGRSSGTDLFRIRVRRSPAESNPRARISDEWQLRRGRATSAAFDLLAQDRPYDAVTEYFPATRNDRRRTTS